MKSVIYLFTSLMIVSKQQLPLRLISLVYPTKNMSRKASGAGVYYRYVKKAFLSQFEFLFRKPHRHCVAIGYGTFVNGPYCILNHNQVSSNVTISHVW